MPSQLSNNNPLLTAPTQNLTPEQDALRWRAVVQRITDLENQLKNTVKFNDFGARGGTLVTSETIKANSVQIVSPSNATIMNLTSQVFGSINYPTIQIPTALIQLIISPQLAVVDVRDSPARPFTLLQDEENAFDATLTQHTYSSLSSASGSTMPNDLFVKTSEPGGLGPGAFVSRRVGILWGAAGNWGVDASYVNRYHGPPSSITLTTVVADNLGGATKSVVDIDYFGFFLQCAGATGGGFTLNRWTASGGF